MTFLETREALGTRAVIPGASPIPPLGLGTWQWGDRRLWRYGHGFGQAEVHAAFQAAVEAGIKLFDTAEIYGRGESERLLGRFVRESGAPVLVATKFMPYPWRRRRGSLLRALEGSLGRLRLPRVDLYQVHFPAPLAPLDRIAEELAEAVRSGMTRAVGVSNYGVERMGRTCYILERRGVQLASNQVEYSLLDRRPERSGLLRACRDLGVTVIAYSPLGKGLLGGRYSPENPPSVARRLAAPRGAMDRLPSLLPLLREIGEAHGGKTPAQVALNWLMAQGAVPIPGAKNARQAAQNAGALGWQLSEEELARLDRVTRT